MHLFMRFRKPHLDAVRVQQLVATDARVRLHAPVYAAEVARDAGLRGADRDDDAKRVGGIGGGGGGVRGRGRRRGQGR